MRLSSSFLPFVAVVFSIQLCSAGAGSEPKIWALLVAGSNRFTNYRHQADVCHAYQILHKNGVPDERIVVMMYDDIANSRLNPTPGIVINHPNGSDVYHGVPKDYNRGNVGPKTFLKVLKGDKDALRGVGSGKVIDSGPEDHVFVYFSDHGARGLVAFPAGVLYAEDLVDTLTEMYENRRFAKLVFYLESCESGSMFSGLLPANISVYAATASAPDEESCACYWDDYRNTYLGDEFSVNWMEDSDVENLSQESLQKQFSIVKNETRNSEVQEYGNLTIGESFTVAQFLGSKGAPAERLPRAQLDAVNSRDVPVAILRRRIQNTFDEDTRAVLQNDLDQMLRNRLFLKNKVFQIAKSLGYAEALNQDLPFKDHTCYRQAVEKFHRICFNLSSNTYSLGFLKTFSNLCESGVKVEDILRTMESVCTHPKISGID